jgi:hypothetical protein
MGSPWNFLRKALRRLEDGPSSFIGRTRFLAGNLYVTRRFNEFLLCCGAGRESKTARNSSE